MDKSDKDLLKLKKLLQHWADHNESHKESFIKWRDIANEHGIAEIVENLNHAIEMMDRCTDYLLKAEALMK